MYSALSMEQIEMEEVGNIKENFVSENEIADTDLDSIAISETKDGNTYDEETGNKSPSTKKISEEEERQRVRKQFYITLPWSPQMYFTVRGAENFHIYLWIAKDIAWTQDEYWPCMIFGCSALAWCSVLMYHSMVERCFEEMYMLLALIIWLSANFVWMAGEVFSGDDDIVRDEAAHMMEAAIGWILLYHLVLRPLNLLPADEAMTMKYEEANLKPRFSYFKNWRQYEHIHTLFWLGKDLSWNTLNPYTWILCLIPTILIAADFIWVTYQTKRMMIDTVHYVAQLTWVMGNFVWALGELYTNPDDDTPYFIWVSDNESRRHARWWSSWVLFGAFFPLIALYFVWLPLTCTGRIKAAEIPENDFVEHEKVTHSTTDNVLYEDKKDEVSMSSLHVKHIKVVDNDSRSTSTSHE